MPYKAFCSVFRPQSSILDALKNLGTLPPAGFMKTTSPPTSHSTTHHGRAQWVPNTYCFRGPSPSPWLSWPMSMLNRFPGPCILSQPFWEVIAVCIQLLKLGSGSPAGWDSASSLLEHFTDGTRACRSADMWPAG